MQLSKTDRIITMFSILPKKDTFENMLMASDIKKKIQLTPEEITSCGFVISENGNVKWNDPERVESEFSFSDAERNFLKQCVDNASKAKSIDASMLVACKKLKA